MKDNTQECSSELGILEKLSTRSGHALFLSIKLWLTICFMHFFWTQVISTVYIILSIIGTCCIFFALVRYTLPLPKKSSVHKMFGKSLRPCAEDPCELSDSETLSLNSRIFEARSETTLRSIRRKYDSVVSIAHRGGGLDAPENTISAFRRCKLMGCQTVEFDVGLTKDEELVVFHDDKLMRLANIDKRLDEMEWKELQNIDISKYHPLGSQYTDEKIPLFQEAVEECLSLGLTFIIDIKGYHEKMVEIIVSAFRKYNLYDKACVSSFGPRVIYEIRRQDPNIIGCMAWRPSHNRYTTWNSCGTMLEQRNSFFLFDFTAILWDIFDEWAIRNFYWWFLGLSCVLLQKDCVSRFESYEWTKKGLRVYLWTVNVPSEKVHFLENVRLGYLTDTLDGGEYSVRSSLSLES